MQSPLSVSYKATLVPGIQTSLSNRCESVAAPSSSNSYMYTAAHTPESSIRCVRRERSTAKIAVTFLRHVDDHSCCEPAPKEVHARTLAKEITVLDANPRGIFEKHHVPGARRVEPGTTRFVHEKGLRR